MKKQVNDNTIPLLILMVFCLAMSQATRDTVFGNLFGIASITASLWLVGSTVKKAFKML